MGKTLKISEDKSAIVAELPAACADEATAVEFMERQRWGDRPGCVHCGSVDVYQMRDRATGERNKRFLWRCRTCGKQYTVRVGTVFEDSAIPLRWWCYAFWRACSSKKGVSALQIKRETGLCYKSALFMMHRIRYAMTTPTPPDEKLTGIVEADETYVGGKPRFSRWGNKSARRFRSKPAIIAVIQRGGQARSMTVPSVNRQTLREAMSRYVDKSATLSTDECGMYRPIGREQRGGHLRVKHISKQYVKGDAHVNTAESYFALIKRGIYGTYHAVSKKHLHRYAAEFEFRWNNRTVDDGERTRKAIRGADGKRLFYREPVKG